MRRKVVSSLLLLGAVAFAPIFPLYAADTAPTPAVESPSPQVDSAAPAAESTPPVASELPAGDLFAPKPHAVCLSGWCSSNTQCVKWYGTGSTCTVASGATCGHCNL
jgi:hypothetical protein